MRSIATVCPIQMNRFYTARLPVNEQPHATRGLRKRDLRLACQMAHVDSVRVRDKRQKFAEDPLIKPGRFGTYDPEIGSKKRRIISSVHIYLPVAKQKKKTILQAATVYHCRYIVRCIFPVIISVAMCPMVFKSMCLSSRF